MSFRKSIYTTLVLILGVGAVALFQACGATRGASLGIPLVAPPVTAATPAALYATTLMSADNPFHVLSVTIADLQERFYPGAGPSDIKSLLESIDTRLTEINTRSEESTHACTSATPVAYDISVMGETVTTYMQCYDVFGDNSGGMLFGTKDNTWYLYTNVGQERVLAKSTPVTDAAGKYIVEAWISVGQGNAADATTCSSRWGGCSYGVIHLSANSNTNELEATMAGTGLGFCSAHLKSDGTNLFLKGEGGGLDLGSDTSWTCDGSTSSVCVLASDLVSAGTCTDVVDDATFALTTIGVSGETTFGNNVTIDGTDTDAVHFGPSVTALQAITGVAAF